jgi:hypothetical protein
MPAALQPYKLQLDEAISSSVAATKKAAESYAKTSATALKLKQFEDAKQIPPSMIVSRTAVHSTQSVLDSMQPEIAALHAAEAALEQQRLRVIAAAKEKEAAAAQQVLDSSRVSALQRLKDASVRCPPTFSSKPEVQQLLAEAQLRLEWEMYQAEQQFADQQQKAEQRAHRTAAKADAAAATTGPTSIAEMVQAAVNEALKQHGIAPQQPPPPPGPSPKQQQQQQQHQQQQKAAGANSSKGAEASAAAAAAATAAKAAAEAAAKAAAAHRQPAAGRQTPAAGNNNSNSKGKGGGNGQQTNTTPSYAGAVGGNPAAPDEDGFIPVLSKKLKQNLSRQQKLQQELIKLQQDQQSLQQQGFRPSHHQNS